MKTLIENQILSDIEKARSGVYQNTSENRRKHRVGQKYGAEKKEEKPEKTDSNKMSIEELQRQLEDINKVIEAINEGKLKPSDERIREVATKRNLLEDSIRKMKKKRLIQESSKNI